MLLLLRLPFTAASAAAQDLPRDLSAKAPHIDRARPCRPSSPPSAAPAIDVTRDFLRGRHADPVPHSLVVASENATATALHVSLEQPFWPVDLPD